MEIRHNITFNLRAYGKNRDKHQIRMRVTYNGRHMDFATGSILEDRNAWDAEAGLVHDGYVGAKGVTADVTTYKGNQRIDEVKRKWELVGTHTGRKTFIVNALSLGVAPNVVMKWTGHSDYKAMKPYIDIVDSVKADSMMKFNGLL